MGGGVGGGGGPDLLIHEATVGNDMKADAIRKKHCTFREAIDSATSMKAK